MEACMTQHPNSIEDKVRAAKQVLHKGRHDGLALRLAVQDWDAILMERLAFLYPDLRNQAYALFAQLQEDRIINAQSRQIIAWGHRLRNKSAHNALHSLTFTHVEKFAAEVQAIIDKTQRRTAFNAQRRIRERNTLSNIPKKQKNISRSTPKRQGSLPKQAMGGQPQSTDLHQEKRESDAALLRRLLSEM
jgi:hypothetical protein